MSEVLTLSHEQVMEIDPHRDPMLLVDEATEYVPGERIVTKFWVDPALEEFPKATSPATLSCPASTL